MLFCAAHREFLWPTSTRCAQMSLKLFHIINDLCHFHTKHPTYYHIYLALCTIYHFNSVGAYRSPLKVLFSICWVLHLPCNCCDIELTEIWVINTSNILMSKTAVQVIFWVSLLVWYQSPQPREAL